MKCFHVTCLLALLGISMSGAAVDGQTAPHQQPGAANPSTPSRESVSAFPTGPGHDEARPAGSTQSTAVAGSIPQGAAKPQPRPARGTASASPAASNAHAAVPSEATKPVGNPSDPV